MKTVRFRIGYFVKINEKRNLKQPFLRKNGSRSALAFFGGIGRMQQDIPEKTRKNILNCKIL